MNVDKRSFLNVDKRSKVNVLNVDFVLGAAFVALGHRFVWQGQHWGCVGAYFS